MAVAALWDTLKHAITAYTGLSPAAFFTVIAIAYALYQLLSGFLAPPPPPRRLERDFPAPEPLPPPVQLGEIEEEELAAYDGKDEKKPLLMAIKGQIYDVTQSRMFYGPGGPYALFAGKDASRALAKMSFEQKDLTGDITGLGPFELEALQDWEYKFMSKYVKVGTLKKPVPATDGPSEGTAEAASAAAETTEAEVHVPEAEHNTEVKENGDAEHVAVSDHEAKEKDNGAVDAESEAKEVETAADSTRE